MTSLSVLAMLTLAGREQALPNLLTGSLVDVPLAACAAIPLLVGIARITHTPLTVTLATASRSAWAVAPLAATCLPLLAGAMLTVIGSSENGARLLRDGCGLIGLMLLSGAITREVNAMAAPLSFLLGCFVSGVNDGQNPYWWAWPLMPATDLRSWVAALGLLSVACGVCALRGSWWAPDQ
ncbi:MAG: hypothetical protein ACRCTR_09535 [Actinomycetota bacterium]